MCRWVYRVGCVVLYSPTSIAFALAHPFLLLLSAFVPSIPLPLQPPSLYSPLYNPQLDLNPFHRGDRFSEDQVIRGGKEE